MIIIKNYQLVKISGNKNFKRICNEIKKIEYVHSATIENTKNIMHIEYNTPYEIGEKELLALESQIEKAIHEYEKKAFFYGIEAKEKYRKVLYLKNIDCAHCAGKIETLAKRTLDNEQIILDFSTGRFIIETYSKEIIDNLYESLSKIAHHVDSRIVVIDKSTSKVKVQEEKVEYKVPKIIMFTLGVVSFLTLVVLDKLNIVKINFLWYLIPYVLIGFSVLVRFLKNLFRGHLFDETFLMGIASIGAFATSHATEAVMVVLLFQIGEFLQSKAVNKSRSAIRKILDISAKSAKIKIDNEYTEVDVEALMPGDIVIVNKGEIMPADGIIINGRTNIDTKNLTGESMLRTVGVNDKVLSGSVNMSKLIEVKVTKPYAESTIAKILDLVENATISKSKTENIIAKFARVYTPLVVATAITVVILGLIFDYNNIKSWIYLAMEFLVISCPCALVISVPLCYFSAVGKCSKSGILVKGSNYIEALSGVKNVVFDKTGTITKGVFSVIKVYVASSDITEERLLNLLMHAEYRSNHPIGISIVDDFGRDKVFPEIISEFQDIPGGAKAVVNGNRVLVGNDKLMESYKVEIPKIQTSNLVIHVVKNRIYQGYVEIGDIIKDKAKDIVATLKKQKIKCCMLTGDVERIASSVANTIGVDDYHYSLLPNQKVEILDEIKKSSTGKVAFVGDGINDAPVIASADVGIAMGSSGNDATVAIADIVIMTGDLDKVRKAISISKYTKIKAIENIVFAIFVKLAVMGLAITLSLISKDSVNKVELPLGIAVFSDVGVTLLAILNSLLILSKDEKKKKGKKNA